MSKKLETALAGNRLTKVQIAVYGDEVALTNMHRESMQAGAEYAYFAVEHELEWDVHEGKVSLEYANELLAKLAEDFNVPVKKVKVSKIPLWYAMTPYRRRVDTFRPRT